MLKSLYSPEFIGTACSQVGAKPFGLALLPSFPTFDVSVVEKDFSCVDSGVPEKRSYMAMSQPGSIPLCQSFEIRVDQVDRFQFKDFDSFAESGVVEGSAVSFNFDAFASTKSETKSIQAGDIYFVKSVDVASSPPFFCVSYQRGAHTSVGCKKISSLKTGVKPEATFYILEEGTPISFGFDIPNPTPNTGVLKAGVVFYAKDVDIITSSASPPSFFFRVALRPGRLQKHINISGIGSDIQRVQIHLTNKIIRAVTVTQEKCITRTAELRDAAHLDALSIVRPVDSLTLEMLQNICHSTFDIDVHLLHVLSSFASACKFFDVSDPGSRSEFQSRMLQDTKNHMENFMKSLRRDVGSLELVEHAAFRLLSLNSMLHSHPIIARVDKKPLESVLNRVQAAWNVVNLYATTVLSDPDGMSSKDVPYSLQRSSSAFCVHNGVFAFARNGFLVIGKASTGKCISLNLDGFTKSDPIDSCQFVATSGFRPCVVDAKFLESNLYIMILTSPESDPGNVLARIFKVDGISFGSDVLVQSVQFHSISPLSLCVGSYFPFNVFVPRFVTKPPRTTRYLHVFAVVRGHSNPHIFSVSLLHGTVQCCELNFPTITSAPRIQWGTFEYISSALVQRPPQRSRQVTAGSVTDALEQQSYQDLWILCRVKVLSTLKVLLWRFALGKSDSTIASALVDEEGLEIPNQDQHGNADLWELCMTNHGLGVGVASPEGHFYHVVKNDSGVTVTARIESPFFDAERTCPSAKYVSSQAPKCSKSPLSQSALLFLKFLCRCLGKSEKKKIRPCLRTVSEIWPNLLPLRPSLMK
jgi:hypothetical protein